MTTRVFIDGAVGTTGLEIAERLEGRGEFTLLTLPDDRRKDDAARARIINTADVVILCLPDDAARASVAMIENPAVRVIDASSAHRTAPGWTYGFPELVGREVIAGARRVSNPGCYATGFVALIAPLVRARLLPADWPYVCHAVSGYSGGGKTMIARFERDPDIAYRAYGLALGHKHLPEMQAHANLRHAPVFAPAVVPAHRGMIVEVPLPLGAMPGAPGADALRACLVQFYGDAALVTVHPPAPEELLLRRGAPPSDRLDLHVFADGAGGAARLVAVLDNLGKGASGAAVQNLNLMAGIAETTALRM